MKLKGENMKYCLCTIFNHVMYEINKFPHSVVCFFLPVCKLLGNRGCKEVWERVTYMSVVTHFGETELWNSKLYWNHTLFPNGSLPLNQISSLGLFTARPISQVKITIWSQVDVTQCFTPLLCDHQCSHLSVQTLPGNSSSTQEFIPFQKALKLDQALRL